MITRSGKVRASWLGDFVNAQLALELEQRRPRSLFVVLCENVSVLLSPMSHSGLNVVGVLKWKKDYL